MQTKSGAYVLSNQSAEPLTAPPLLRPLNPCDVGAQKYAQIYIAVVLDGPNSGIGDTAPFRVRRLPWQKNAY
jgi:hypothetical protein